MNDGRQFTVTNIRQKNPGSPSGYLAWPYDSTVQSTYQMVDSNGRVSPGLDIQQYHIVLDVTGDESEQITATVGIYENGDADTMVELDKKTLTMGKKDSFTLQGQLPRPLVVERGMEEKEDGDDTDNADGCARFVFKYGTGKDDGIRAFMFNSENKGYGAWSHTEKGAASGKYCVLSSIRADNKRKAGDDAPPIIGTRYKCSFPGW